MANVTDGRSLGQQLGRYQQVATLGQGGMGTVYLALAKGLGQFRKLLVIKELRQDFTLHKGFIRLFMDEAKLAARLSHPNVVQTFEAIQDGNRYLLAMEYLDGQSLSALITRTASGTTRALRLDVHIHILCEVLSGLHYAHELRDYDGTRLRVVHRDVSPQNVFLSYHGEVKVVDFGVASAANAANSTVPGVFVGKFAYAAPEQILGRPVDARTDVFAVGVMLWQAIAQRRFSLASPTPEAFRGRAEGIEPRIRALVPEVDPELADICDRAMAVDPDERFSSAQAFRSALQAYMEARNVHVHDADLAHLMQQVFEVERATLDAQIEAVVQASGTQERMEPLSFPPEEQETAKMLEVGVLLRDEPQRGQSTAAPPSPSRPSLTANKPGRLWWAAAGCGLAATLVWALSEGRSEVLEAKVLAPALVTVERVQRVAALEPVVGVATLSAAPALAAVKPRRTAAARSNIASKRKTQAVRTETEALPARIEAGADLGISRRAAPERIDLDNPYP